MPFGGLTRVHPRNHVVDGVQITQGNLWGLSGSLKSIVIESLLLYVLQKINDGIFHSATPAADCNAADWSMVHYIAPMKNPPLRCGLSSELTDHLLNWLRCVLV